ncbi:hypothetical protein BDV95DRAFT_500983 [Massariosphaeria phaeospora]|uniref:Putative gamma-glutamylcyclotransferase n=1 Tax=Massariosphaeria phaeospora TaxID=100035 RepID=A0A7C8I1C4_9PLEO|nr:hypothetical protein BDV95DRAFT_500983 [Massariosphaeria phaeospora]
MSYTYELAQKQRPVTQPPTPSSPRPKSRKRYLFKLAYPLDSAKKLQDLASLPETPEVLDDEEDTESRFVVVDDATRATIEAHMRGFSPIFTSLRTPADKNLSRTSLAPTLGIDPTIPQHRVDTSPSPAQDEYPVLYFFYGTLAEPERLVRELGLDELPTLAPAEIRRGRMRMAGKYRALVDGDEKDVVQGAMYVVGCREHEDVLRHYESDLYEVVRCDIFGEKGEMVKGLTFRFAGDAAMLK